MNSQATNGVESTKPTEPSTNIDLPEGRTTSNPNAIVLTPQTVYRNSEGALHVTSASSPHGVASSSRERSLSSDSFYSVASNPTSTTVNYTQNSSTEANLLPNPSQQRSPSLWQNISHLMVPPSRAEARAHMQQHTSIPHTEANVRPETTDIYTMEQDSMLHVDPTLPSNPQDPHTTQTPSHRNTASSTSGRPGASDANGIFAGFNPLTGTLSLGASVATVSTLTFSNILEGAQNQLSSAASYITDNPIVASLPTYSSLTSYIPLQNSFPSWHSMQSTVASSADAFSSFIGPYLELEYWRSLFLFFMNGEWLSWDYFMDVAQRSRMFFESVYLSIFSAGQVVAIQAGEGLTMLRDQALAGGTNSILIGIASVLLLSSVTYAVYRYSTRTSSSKSRKNSKGETSGNKNQSSNVNSSDTAAAS